MLLRVISVIQLVSMWPRSQQDWESSLSLKLTCLYWSQADAKPVIT